MVVKCLNKVTKVEKMRENIDYVARLGGRRRVCPILIKITSVSKMLKVLNNKRNLITFKVRVDEEFSIETRRIRKELVPYLKDARKWGHKAFLIKDILIVNEWMDI
jgi:hypothetical protein